MAYLRISEGCNQKCTFCTIPSIRGTMRSKPLDGILAEARELSADGTVELNLIGQDTTSYGVDIGYEPGLAGLLRELNRLEGVRWLRLMYAYPSDFSDEMIDAIAECAHIVKYIDMPLQHINDRMLRAMYRRVTRAQTQTLLDKLRARIPGAAIRTTMIAGFPGETPEEFEELVEFVRQFRFDALGVFAYSTEPGTPAARMKDMLPQAEREARRDALMAVQQDVAARIGQERIGTTFDALIEGRHTEDATYVARAAFQAPDVDGLTFATSANTLTSGSIVRMRCTGAAGYDLQARPCDVTLPLLSA
jgi:ribosomal protein S12 methylthiotransferase